MSASVETRSHLLRGIVPDIVEPEASFASVFRTKISQFRRLLSEELGCLHDNLVFDDINDVHCQHCGKDFTG